jgi:4-hydroxybenzoate polyprenyltransferase
MVLQLVKITNTLRVLASSIMIAISGAFRANVAFLLLGVNPVSAVCIEAGLITYVVYTIDRAIGSKEDEINRLAELRVNKYIIVVVVAISLIVIIHLASCLRISFFTITFPFIMGFMYSKGIRIGKSWIRLKGSLRVKNTVVAFTWATFLCLLVYPWAENTLQIFPIFYFFFLKSLINTIICDCRDLKGDSIGGLRTIPVCLGEWRTKILLYNIHFIFHTLLAVFVIFNIVKFNWFILFFSWVAGLIYIYVYATSRKTIFRSIIVHGEWAYMVGARNLTVFLYS